MNFLLLSASICASKSVEQKTVLPAEETVTVLPEETLPVEEKRRLVAEITREQTELELCEKMLF